MKFLIKKVTAITLVAFALSMSHAQDSLWSKLIIDENLSISFPPISFESDTSFERDGKNYRFRVLRAETESSVLGLVITPNETNINANNQESLISALEGMAKGSVKSLSNQGFNCAVSDTLIESILCKKITCLNEYASALNAYIFLINDKMYAFQGSAADENNTSLALNDLNRVLKSIRFTSSTVKEQQFSTRAESIGYNIGRLLVPLLIVAAIIAFIARKL